MNFFSHKGRSTQGEVLSSILYLILFFIITVLLSDIFVAVFKGYDFLAKVYSAFSFLILLTLFYHSLAVNIKRFHDRDKSGWWVLVTFIPVIGFLWIMIELCSMKGTAGPNKYGDEIVA